MQKTALGIVWWEQRSRVSRCVGSALVIYYNGVKIGDYKQGIFPLFAKDNCGAIWGIRHGDVAGGPGNLDAKIEDARIYATVLSQGGVKALCPDTLAIEALAKLATAWAAIKAR